MRHSVELGYTVKLLVNGCPIRILAEQEINGLHPGDALNSRIQSSQHVFI